MSVSILLPVLVDSQVLFVDLASASVHKVDGVRASADVEGRVLSELEAQQESSAPSIPYEQIREVMMTERNLAKDNAKHIFRRN